MLFSSTLLVTFDPFSLSFASVVLSASLSHILFTYVITPALRSRVPRDSPTTTETVTQGVPRL